MFEVFQFGPFLFRSSTLFLVIGIVLSATLFLRLAESAGLQLKHIYENFMWYAVAFIIGGRLFAILVLYQLFRQDFLRIFIFWDGTFSYLGGCLGVAIVLFILTWRYRTTYLQWLDQFAPAVTIGWACEWVGRFLGNISYGKPTDMPWGVIINSMQVRYTVPIHPVQLYYATALLGITYVLLKIRKRPDHRAGMVTLVAVLLSSCSTLLFEFFRGDFAVIIFAKITDFIFLALLFCSFGAVIALERRISSRYSLINSLLIGCGTILYLVFRPLVTIASVEWRFSQFLAVLALIGLSVYVGAHRWKYPEL